MRRRPPTPQPPPWREGNEFRLLVDGERFYPAMLGAINRARKYILLEMYLFESGHVADRFIDALVTATRRGVKVFGLLDDFGASGLDTRDRRRLAEAGVYLSWYNPLRFERFGRNLSRNHRKLLLVDGHVAFTGGLGITDAFAPTTERARRWRDTVVQVRGPVVSDWRALFEETWSRATGRSLPEDNGRPPGIEDGARGKVSHSHGIRPIAISQNLVERTLAAKNRVWLATAYFIPSHLLGRTLRRKAREGVDVRLLLPGPITDHPSVRYASRRYYTQLLREGVRIFEYQPRFLHAKVALCDGWISIGSSNFDRWNLHRNLEANQEIEDPSLAAQVQHMFESDFKSAREINYDAWLGRPPHERMQEWFWGRIELLLEKGG